MITEESNKQQIETEIAKELLSVKAVFLSPQSPFTWASGILSPIYCDNRLTLSYPSVRRKIETALAHIVQTEYPDCEVVMGTSTAGIPHAAFVAEILGLPMGYVRGDSKSHGRQNRIEGVPPVGKKVVVVEDLISTAGSSLEVVQALREIGSEVLGIVSIFTYGMQKGIDRLQAADVKNVSLTNFPTLAKVARNEGYISEKEYAMVMKFQQNPSDPTWREE